MTGTDWLILGALVVGVLTYIGAWAWMDMREMRRADEELAAFRRRLSPPVRRFVPRVIAGGRGARS